MNNKDILQKAITKAKKNGWKLGEMFEDIVEDLDYCEVQNISDWYCIYDHGFAKAFWGEVITGYPPMYWEKHLQQMVLEKEPLKYIEKYLKDL